LPPTARGRYPPPAAFAALCGRLAQLGEHQLDKLGVTGSSPVPPIGPGSPLARRPGADFRRSRSGLSEASLAPVACEAARWGKQVDTFWGSLTYS
jgi:hypothetical protein